MWLVERVSYDRNDLLRIVGAAWVAQCGGPRSSRMTAYGGRKRNDEKVYRCDRCVGLRSGCMIGAQAGAMPFNQGEILAGRMDGEAIVKVAQVHRGVSMHANRNVHVNQNVRVNRNVNVNRNMRVNGRPGVVAATYHGSAWARPYRWAPGGAIAAGAAGGFVSAATAATWAAPPPQPGLCWYYIDASKRNGFWDNCP